MSNIHTTIDTTVKSNDVVLFMKGTVDAPMCGFSLFSRNSCGSLSCRGYDRVFVSQWSSVIYMT